jgi:hypothetical protein
VSAPQTTRRGERGQTLPVYLLAIITSLSLIFFSFNYANTLHWQMRAQTAADAAASAALSFQSLDFNKMSVLLYTADVEEWRTRHLLQAMLDVGVYHPTNGGNNTSSTIGNGGCTFPAASNMSATPSSSKPGGSCFWIYKNLYDQYLKSVARYTKDIEIIQSTAANMTAQQQSYDVQWNVHLSGSSCNYPIDCAFSYYLIDYSNRPTTRGVGRDAGYVQMGGFPETTTPIGVWQPARIEVAACKTVQPLVHFNFFGLGPQPFTVIGRAAATNVPINEEWLAPGVDQATILGGVFAPTEVYNVATDPAYATQDTYGASQSPRPWYETSYPALPYTARPSSTSMPYTLNRFGDDFEALVSWWTSAPIAPYVTTSFTQAQLCSQAAPP